MEQCKKNLPIDKTKKSNRRCWNCAIYAPYGSGEKSYDERLICTASGKERKVAYWNCCKHFQLNTSPNQRKEKPNPSDRR